MRIKIVFAVFQDGRHSEDVELEHEFSDQMDLATFLAFILNNNQSASLPAARDHRMEGHLDVPLPPLKEGYGSGTILIVKDVELMLADLTPYKALYMGRQKRTDVTESASHP